ncbi:MAG: phosphate uptake regulator PhoU [Dehalococcoidia bacterium]|nr:phosphate uptake regulator PhoU [Dehalococcoidia bacterium]
MEALELSLKGFFDGEGTYVQTRAWSNTILILSEEVEDRATDLMALHQPMASDLRTLKAYIKIAYDLERFGRYAMDISEIRNRIGEWEPIPDEEGFREMGEKTKACVTMSLEFIETMNERLMWDMSKLEAETDQLYLANLGRLSESEEHSKTIIAYLLTIRYLERIADHASYISESISYAVTGKRVSLR